MNNATMIKIQPRIQLYNYRVLLKLKVLMNLGITKLTEVTVLFVICSGDFSGLASDVFLFLARGLSIFRLAFSG